MTIQFKVVTAHATFRPQGGWSLSQQWDDTLNKLPVYLMANTEKHISQPSQEVNSSAQGPRLGLNMQPSCCEAPMLTTAASHLQHMPRRLKKTSAPPEATRRDALFSKALLPPKSEHDNTYTKISWTAATKWIYIILKWQKPNSLINYPYLVNNY